MGFRKNSGTDVSWVGDTIIVEGRCWNGMYAYGPDPEGEAVGEGLRGVSEDSQHMGASEDVHGVRACGMLRLLSA